MSKIIAAESPATSYSIIPNQLIRNSNISDGAFRLISWVSSHQEGFEISFASIKRFLGYGRDKLRAILKEAEEFNYLIRRKIRVEGGVFDWEYYVFLDPSKAIAFRESIGGKSVYGDGQGGQTRSMVEPPTVEPEGGYDHPHNKNNIEDQNKKEQQKEEETSLSKDNELEIFDKQPAPENLTLLTSFEESKAQSNNLLSRSNIPSRSFEIIEQKNIDLSSVDTAKLEKYQNLDASGIKLKQPELRDWARLSIGDYVKTYRKSGFILTGGNDVSTEFAIYVAKQNCKKGQEPTIALGFNVINKCESEPRCWQKLAAWVVEWQGGRICGQQTNIAAAVDHQHELERIREAASKKFEL